MSSTAPEPWPVAVVRRIVAANVAALAALMLCGWAVAGKTRLSEQVLWLNVAVLTLVAAGIANAVGVAAARRAVTGRARMLLGPGHPGAATPGQQERSA